MNAKPIFNFFLVILFLPFILSFFIVIFVLIKLSEPRSSVIFAQPRVGKNGKIFICYKFRTMRENGDEILKKYLKTNPDEIENYERFHKFKNDPRITKVGAFLRKSSLDEIPQFFNVLKGDMSIVGPRPYLPLEFEKSSIGSDKINKILSVKPGITGIWQVNGNRSEVEFKLRMDMDLWYVENYNFILDFKIILKTIFVVLRMSGK